MSNQTIEIQGLRFRAVDNGDGTFAVAVSGGGGGSGVTSFNGRTGAVVPATNDYSYSQLSGSPPVSSVFGRTGVVVAAANDYSFAQLSGSAAVGQLPSAIPIANIGSAGLSGTLPISINAAGAISLGQVPISLVGSAGLSGTSPVTISAAGAIGCATCVTASSPGAGIAHFAGGTQVLTSSTVNLANGDVSGQLPITAVGSAGLSGTSPVTISAAGAIGCATCNTSAAAITNNVLAKGSGGAQGLANSLATDDATSFTYTGSGGVKASAGPLTSGANGGAAGQLSLFGSTSGTQTLTTSASGSNLTITGGVTSPAIAATSSYTINGRVFVINTIPTIATGGCGGSGATISNTAGTATFDINVGTTPTAAGCTITMPGAFTGWACFANNFTTISSTVFVQKQTASSTTSVTIKTFDTTGTPQAPVAGDVYHVSCFAR